jgi:uncharacterized protein YggU (UPF0235/DUF167 family)
VHEGALVVRLRARPVEGAANDALLRFLSGLLETPFSSIQLLRGASSRDKLVRIEGLTADEVVSRLGLPPSR